MKTVWVLTVNNEIIGAGTTLHPILDTLADKFPNKQVTIGSGNIYLDNKKTNIHVRQVFVDNPEVWYFGNIQIDQ